MRHKPPFSLKEDLRPADLWFWKDWQSSLDIKLCHLASRGLWMEMLGVMFNSKTKGTLAVNGKKMDSKELAKIVDASVEEVEACLAELESRGVFSRLEDGTIINRRMYRGESLRFLRAKAGKIGARRRWQKDSKPIATSNSKTIAPLAIEYGIVIEDENYKNKNLKEAMAAWNDFAQKWNLRPIQEIEPGSAREAHLRARMKKKEFSLEALLQKIEKQPFLLGKNDKAWTITFDWIICPSNYTKIMEEQYPARAPRDDVAKDRRVGATKRPTSDEEKRAQEEARAEFQAEGKK